MKHYRAKTTYFLTEGKSNLSECLKLCFSHAKAAGIQNIVVFTSAGEGLELACKKFLTSPQFSDVRITGVSFPIGIVPTEALEVPDERRKLLEEFGIPIIRAAFPLNFPIEPTAPTKSPVQIALEFFSGGTVMCLNAAIVACDAGRIQPGEHVIVMAADTAYVVKATPSSMAHSALSVREIICKPLIQDITKGESLALEVNIDVLLKTRSKRTKTLSAPLEVEQEKRLEE
jgi:hypothetical protein